MITGFKWELNCLKHLGKAMQKSGPGTFLAKARECSSSFQLGYSNFIIPLTSVTSRILSNSVILDTRSEKKFLLKACHLLGLSLWEKLAVIS